MAEEEGEVALESSSQGCPQLSCLWSVCRQLPVSGCSLLFSARATFSCGRHPATNVPALCSAWCAVAAVSGPPVASSPCVSVQS